jgi:Flp pilus assembly protein CpaB
VKRSNRLLILLGVFLAVIAMMAVVVIGGGGTTGGPKTSPTPTKEPTVQVVIAKVDIAPGERITSDMVETQTMTVSERDELGFDTFTRTSSVVDKTAGGPITKGDPFSPESFMTAGAVIKGQDLAKGIAPGKVLIAMEVDQVNGVGTLLVPNDHVDVILSVYVEQIGITAKVEDKTWLLSQLGQDVHDVTTKMIIQNRKVLAVLLPPVETNESPGAAAPSGSPTPSSSSETITNNGQHMIVLVEVLPEEAEIIRWAQREEITDPQNYITLGLVLRSAEDNDAPPVTTQGITYKQLVTVYGVLPPDPRAELPSDLAKMFTW